MSKAMDSIQKSELNVRTFLGLIIFFSKFTKYLNKTKLNKLMFFTDFGYYSKTKEKITSARYIHMPFGPVPEEIDIYLAELEEKEFIDINVNFTSFLEYRIKAVDDIEFFNYLFEKQKLLDDTQLGFAHMVNDKFGRRTAGFLSDFSHELTPYKNTKEYHPISYEEILKPQPLLNNIPLHEYIESL